MVLRSVITRLDIYIDVFIFLSVKRLQLNTF